MTDHSIEELERKLDQLADINEFLHDGYRYVCLFDQLETEIEKKRSSMTTYDRICQRAIANRQARMAIAA